MPTEAEFDVTNAVYVEQVRSLFKQIPIALSVNLVNAALVAIVLTPLATRPLPLPWFVSVVLVTIGRGILWLAIARARFSPKTLAVGHGWQPAVRCSAACAGGSAESSCFRSSRRSASSFSSS
jgi:hypothetical protein